MKYIKLLFLSILLVIIFKWLTLSGFNLLQKAPKFQEESIKKLENYYLTKGFVNKIILLEKKYYRNVNNPQSSTYKQTFEYQIKDNNQIEKVKEIRETSKKSVKTTYQIGDTISFYKHKDPIYKNLLIKDYQLQVRNKDKNTFNTFGLLFFSIGSILNLLIGFIIYKSIKKELIN